MSEAKRRSIKGLRADFGLTQVDLAKEIGVDVQTIRNWEKDQDSINGRYLKRLSIFFKVTTDEILGV